MSINPQIPKIILFHTKEIQTQSNKQYLVITDKGNEKHKISEKRQNLWGMFNSAIDAEPFMLVYETYNSVQYVANAKPITDELLKVAIRDIGLKLTEGQNEERNRSTALSYAKDLVVGNSENIENLYRRATQNHEFIKGKDNGQTQP